MKLEQLSNHDNHRLYLDAFQARHDLNLSLEFAMEAIRFAVERDVAAPKWTTLAMAAAIDVIQAINEQKTHRLRRGPLIAGLLEENDIGDAV